MRVRAALLLAALSVGCNGVPNLSALAADQALVVFSRADPVNVQYVDCPPGQCSRVAIEDLLADNLALCRSQPLRTVILSGDALEPRFLSHSAGDVARVLRCVGGSELLVLDICFGATTSLLDSLAAPGSQAVVVAATEPLPAAGLQYGPLAFGTGPATERAGYITGRADLPLQRFVLRSGLVAEAIRQTDAWSPTQLSAALRHVNPNLVSVRLDVPESQRIGANHTTLDVLVPVPPERFQISAQK